MKAHYKAKCSIHCLSQIRDFVRTQLTQLEVNENLIHQLVLAVDEACANSIIHQHHNDGTSEFDLFIQRDQQSLRIEIRDIGTPFPIDDYSPEDVQTVIQKGNQGGLGIHLITRIMDKVEVVRGKKFFTYRFVKYL